MVLKEMNSCNKQNAVNTGSKKSTLSIKFKIYLTN